MHRAGERRRSEREYRPGGPRHCELTAKIKAAKDAGAIAVVVVNNRSDDLATWAEGVFPIEMGAGSPATRTSLRS